jgi:hypothetical protein
MLVVFLIIFPIMFLFSVAEMFVFWCLCGERGCLRCHGPIGTEAPPPIGQVAPSERCAAPIESVKGEPIRSEDTVIVLMPDTSAMLGASSALSDLDAATKESQVGASSEVSQSRGTGHTGGEDRRHQPVPAADADRVPRSRLACIWQPRANFYSEGGISLVLYPSNEARNTE